MGGVGRCVLRKCGATDGGAEASQGNGDALCGVNFPVRAGDGLGLRPHAQVDGPVCFPGRTPRQPGASDRFGRVDADEVCGGTGACGDGKGEGAVMGGEVGGVHDHRLPSGEGALHHAVDAGEDGAMLLGAVGGVREEAGADGVGFYMDGVETGAEIPGDGGFSRARQTAEDDEEGMKGRGGRRGRGGETALRQGQDSVTASSAHAPRRWRWLWLPRPTLRSRYAGESKRRTERRTKRSMPHRPV